MFFLYRIQVHCIIGPRLLIVMYEDPLHADCNLVCDGMSIKSSTIYNKTTGSFEGFVDFGCDIISDDENSVATEALVFMLVSLRKNWKYPIGYVLINKIDATNLHSLLSQALQYSVENNLKVYSITMDGTSTNLAAMKLFGCKLYDSGDVDGKFQFPGYSHDMFFIPGACHMIKLARNALADLCVLTTNNQSIEWKYISMLHEIQIKEGLKFANKLSNRHIEFQKLKMKVSIAAQTLSSSVADALEFLMKSGDSKFEKATATIEFIRVIDKLFDLLNSKNLLSNGFKKPLKKVDMNTWIGTIDSSIDYLRKLCNVYGTPLCKHRRKTFVIGFATALSSVKKLALYLLCKNENPYSFVLINFHKTT